MAKVYSIDGIIPVVHPSAYLHPSAVLIGDVIIGEGVYVGPNASLRGDYGRLIVERGSNIQDCCIMHGYPGTDTIVGEDVSVGHGAVVHGCVIERDALIGMNAVVNDNARVGESSVVAAMAFVRAEMQIPPRTLVAGIPAKVVRELSEQEIEWKRSGTRLYQNLTLRSLASMKEAAPLAQAEPDRRRIDLGDVLPLSKIKKKLAKTAT